MKSPSYAMRNLFIPLRFEWNKLKQFLKNKSKDLLAVFVCLIVVIIFTLLIGNADSGPKLQFTANTIIDLSGTDTTLYALSGSEADSITVSGSTLTADIPAGSHFTLGTGNNTVLKTTPSGNAVSLNFNTIYLSSGYVSQWTISGSGTGVSFLVGVPEANADYLVKANGEKYNYYKSTGAKEISFSYTGDLTRKAFEVIRENQPVGSGLPATAFQAPAAPKQGFSVSINNGDEKTIKREVILTLNGGPDAKRMSISESIDFADASQEPFTTTKSWLLSEGDGLKTVYVKFFTQYGQPTEVISDSIILDTTLPQQLPQEETKDDKTIPEEPVITPTSTLPQTVKEEKPKTPTKATTSEKTSLPAKTTTVTVAPITPKTTIEKIMPAPIEIIEEAPDNEITSFVEPQIIPEEQPVSPEKKDEPVKTEKSIIKYVWQGVVSLFKKLWPF